MQSVTIGSEKDEAGLEGPAKGGLRSNGAGKGPAEPWKAVKNGLLAIFYLRVFYKNPQVLFAKVWRASMRLLVLPGKKWQVLAEEISGRAKKTAVQNKKRFACVLDENTPAH